MKELSVTMIAERSGHPHSRVNYCIHSRGIEPVKRVANIRLFSEEQYGEIVSELDDIAQAEKLKNRRQPEAASSQSTEQRRNK